MKKILLTILAIAPLGLFAQTTIVSDNFDSYTLPATAAGAGSSIWQTWSGGSGTAEDAKITDSIYSSPNNCMFVKNGGPSVYLTDIVMPLPSTLTTGKYEFKMKLYVPQGAGAYFNLGGNWASGGAGYTYGGDFYFNGDGSGNVDAPSTMPFTYNVAAWNDISVMVDLGVSPKTKTLKVNGVVVGTSNWLATAGFGVVDIFGVAYGTAANTTQIQSSFYVDDVEILDWNIAGIEEKGLDANISIYPSPNNGQFTLAFNEALSAEYTVTITDLSGKIIETSSVQTNEATQANFDLKVTPGMYLVRISDGVKQTVQKITVQ